ncbi:gas vesicle protein [Kitasatospora sp. NPDC059571]|uniref:gas vesicle protein GvpO n=1 Tax=Kitasatospora sp. NPDC059571 TaxID=3346871 RepID=UPI0036992F5E
MAAGTEDSAGDREPDHEGPREPRTAPRRRASKRAVSKSARRVSAPRAMRYAAEQLAELLGRAPESVSALKPTEEGWQADVEVVELARIPDTTSVMASYRVTLDEDGELLAYQRIRRYSRGQIDRPT